MTTDLLSYSANLITSQRAGAPDLPLIGAVTIGGALLDLAFQNTRVTATVSLNGAPQLLTYNWFVDGKLALSGSDNFVPAEAYVGKQLSLTVTGVDGNGVTSSMVSNTLPVINVNDLPQGAITIDAGPQTAGSTLHATSTISDADGLGTLSYVWQADGQQIAGATNANLTLTSAQAGKTITVTASYIDGHGHAESVASDAAPPSYRPNQIGTTTTTGTLASGQTLHTSLIDTDGTSDIYYQWQTSDAAGQAWTSVAGATGSSITLGNTVPAMMRVLINYADNAGNVEGKIAIVASEQADVLKIPYNNYTLAAGGGNDTIYYNGGYNIVDGGAGVDTFVSPYTQIGTLLSHTGTHTWSLFTYTGQATSLIDVERIKYADVSLALDTDGVAGQAFRLYQAAFNRAPDQVGLGFWISKLDNGASLTDVANAFVHSDEFTALYGSNPANAALVSSLYQNILHRAPEPAGYQFWLGVLDRHAVTVADVLVNFSDSAENVAALVGVLSNGVTYVPYA